VLNGIRVSEDYEVKENFGKACFGTVLEHPMCTNKTRVAESVRKRCLLRIIHVELYDWECRRAFLYVIGTGHSLHHQDLEIPEMDSSGFVV
jgi:hypothetical protein